MDEDNVSSSGDSGGTLFDTSPTTPLSFQIYRTITDYENGEDDATSEIMETSPFCGSSSSSTTNYIESDTISNDDKTVVNDGGESSNPTEELMTVSVCSSIASSTDYSCIDVTDLVDYHDQGIDVIDGPDSPETSNQDGRTVILESASTNSLATSVNSADCLLPLPPTDMERIARTSEWVVVSVPTAHVEEDESYRRTTAIDYIENLIKLCADKLDKCPLFLTTVGSVSTIEEEVETVFQQIVTLLQTNHVTEGLMQIINLIWGTSRNMDGTAINGDDNNNKNSKSRELMLMILNCASPVSTRLYPDKMEKILSHDIFNDSDYFQNVSLCTNIKTPSKEFVIFQSVEVWINRALDLSLQCRTAIIDLDIRIILEVVQEVNQERNLYLSPDEESKYAAKAQRVVRETFFNRCHTFLRSQGFCFEVLLLQHPTHDMSYLPRNDGDRIVPNAQIPTRDPRHLNDPYTRNEVIEAFFPRDNEDRNMVREVGSPRQQPSSQGSVASLREDAVSLDDGQWGRMSQSSLESRMNQGYASSQNSWSQGSSLPGLPSSQSSANSEIRRFLHLENQEYILENQFEPSSPESSQESPWKRPRYSNSQQ